MLTDIIFNLAGVLVFLFLFWKKLKEDYISILIFTPSFYMLLGVFLGLIFSKIFWPDFWFWLSFLGISAGLILAIKRFHLRTFETVEAGAISLLPWLMLLFWEDAITSSSLGSFLGGIVSGGLIVLYVFLDRHYKNFSWYISGRVGFSGLSILGLFFLIRAAISIFTVNVLSFVKAETLVSGILAFAFFLLVFNLARQKV